MRTLWVGFALGLVSPLAVAQTTIYKHVDDSGRVTYSNRPMKGATVLDLQPISTIPGVSKPAPTMEKAAEQRLAAKPAVAVVTARTLPTTVASVDRQAPPGREESRRTAIEEELAQEEGLLAQARKSLLQEQQNPALIAAVRIAQAASDPTPVQQAEMRANIERASGRIRGLQSTVTEHENNIEALKKELGALKP
jgi:hypothetical protein